MERCENRCFFYGLSIYVGSLLIDYIDISGTGSAYGPAGSLIVILVWVYYSCHFILWFEFIKLMQNIPDAELNQLIMPFMWSNLKKKL
jgi:membrane protein